MKKTTIAISVFLLMLALPALSHVGDSPVAVAPLARQSVALSTTPVEFVGTVDTSLLPDASGPSSGLGSLLSVIPSVSTRSHAASTAAAFQVIDVKPGSSYINVAKSLEGTPGYNPNPCLCAPSDMGLGASSKYVFQMVNLAGTIYTTGGTLTKQFSLSDFWFLQVRSMSDPEVVFDARAGRWFASILFIVNHVRFAVSATDNPLGTWYIYQVSTPASDILPDQPFIGYSDDKFVIASDDFHYDANTGLSGAYLGVQYWILNKAQMMAGAFTVASQTNTPDSTAFRVTPMPALSATFDAYMAENCLTLLPGGPLGVILDNDCPSTLTTTDGGIKVYTITGTPPFPTTVSIQTVPIQQTGFPNKVDQPADPASLATNANSVYSAVWNQNRIWTALNDGNNGGPCVVPACTRLDEIATPVFSTSVALQDFDFTSNGASSFFSAVSTDTSNNLVVMFETSSSTLYPSLLVTGQLTSAAPETLAPSRTVQAGSAVDRTGRWGDYYRAATQPGATSTFWVSGGYRTIELFQGWQTRIGQITFATGNPPPPPPPPCTESDGSGDFKGQQQGNFAFDNDGCKDGDQDQVSSTNRGDGNDFHSTMFNTVQYDSVAHTLTVTGVGVSAGRTVSFVFIALETGPTTPGWVSLSFSDGYSNAGVLLNGSILLH